MMNKQLRLDRQTSTYCSLTNKFNNNNNNKTNTIIRIEHCPLFVDNKMLCCCGLRAAPDQSLCLGRQVSFDSIESDSSAISQQSNATTMGDSITDNRMRKSKSWVSDIYVY